MKIITIIKNIFFLLAPSIVAMLYSSVRHDEWGWLQRVLLGKEDLVD